MKKNPKTRKSVNQKIIIGNWKMNPLSREEAENIFSDTVKFVGKTSWTTVVICPPSIFLITLKKELDRISALLLKSKTSKSKSKVTELNNGGNIRIFLGIQNVFEENPPLGIGPYTGEVSASMSKDLGVKYSIVGHSERRAKGETGEQINSKIKILLQNGITPILCIGEKERDANHEYFNFVKNQLEQALSGIKKEEVEKIIIAYEPVWAISTTKDKRVATPSDFKEMYIYIKKVLANKYGMKIKLPRIIYGGSVGPKTAEGFLTEGGADGLLVGKESLNPANFLEIVGIAENAK